MSLHLGEMSETKRDILLSQVTAHPEVDVQFSDWISACIENAGRWITVECRLPRYPELSVGISKSGINPDVNLSSLSSNVIYLYVNGSSKATLELDLSKCINGDATAAELQSKIRGWATTDGINYGFDEVSVSYTDNSGEAPYYTIESGRYGEESSIIVEWSETYKAIVRAMHFTPTFGGAEFPGMQDDYLIDGAVVELVKAMYFSAGTEGIRSGSAPGGISFAKEKLPSLVRYVLNMRRRLPI